MRYSNVCIEALSHVIPTKIVSSEMIEKWLKPVYERLHLPEGRLELMTGIRERRFWEDNTLPSDVSARAGQLVLEKARMLADQIDCLLHCSVSRDFVEPATSTSVHRKLGLPAHALNFDISNACLGVLSGMIIMANMIELNQIKSGLIVAGENSKPLVATTVKNLVEDTTLTRRDVKPQFASLTIGSAACAVLLTHRSISSSGHRLLGGAHFSDTRFNHLCQGDADTGMTGGSTPHMATDSEQLLIHGIEVASETWRRTKGELHWDDDTPDVICTHQVGRAHSKLMYENLGLDPEKGFSTFEFLGNCGSASLPVTASMAADEGRLKPGDNLAMLGIGSGINCTMLGVEWHG